MCSQEHIDDLVVQPSVTVQTAEFCLVEPNILLLEGSYLVLRDSAIHSCGCSVPRSCAKGRIDFVQLRSRQSFAEREQAEICCVCAQCVLADLETPIALWPQQSIRFLIGCRSSSLLGDLFLPCPHWLWFW